MDVRTDIVQLDRAIQKGATRGFDDTTHFLTWATETIKFLIGHVNEFGGIGTMQKHSVLVAVEAAGEMADVSFFIDPSWNALTCPVIEGLEEFSLV